MKKHAIICSVLAIALVAAIPSQSLAWSRHSYRGHGGYSGGAVAGALLGGVLLGTVIGSTAHTHYYAPERVYVSPPPPPPVYVYPAPSYREDPPGEWVTVPGRWVDGRWVPAHRVWVPID